MLAGSIICQLCQESLTSPLVPPCNHLFCRKCIMKHFQEIRKCPKCEYTIPPGSELEEVLRPHPVSSLIDRMKQIDDALRECNDDCSVKSEGCQKYAEWYCNQCMFWLCRNCEENHRKFLQDHNIKSSIEHRVEVLGASNYPETLCPHHEGNRLEVFCISCQVLVCHMCMQSVHIGHDSCDVKTVFQKNKVFEQVLQEKGSENRLTHEYGRLNTFNKAIDIMREEILSYVDDVVRSLHTSRDRYIQELDTTAQSVRTHLESNVIETKERRATEILATLFYRDLVKNYEDIHMFMARNILDSLRTTLSSCALEKKMTIKFPAFVRRDNFSADIGKLILPSANFLEESTDNDHSDGSLSSIERSHNDIRSGSSSTFRSLRRHDSHSGHSTKSSVVSSALSREPDTPTQTPTTVFTIHVSGSGHVYINQDKENISDTEDKIEHISQQNHVLEPLGRKPSIDMCQSYNISEKVPTLSNRTYVVDVPQKDVEYSKTLENSCEDKTTQYEESDRKSRRLPNTPPNKSEVDVVGDHRVSCSDTDNIAALDTLQNGPLSSERLPERGEKGCTHPLPSAQYKDYDRKHKPLPDIPLEKHEIDIIRDHDLYHYEENGLLTSDMVFDRSKSDNNLSCFENKDDNSLQELAGDMSKNRDWNSTSIYEQVSIDICEEDNNLSVSSNISTSEAQKDITLQYANRRKSKKNDNSSDPKRKSWIFLGGKRKKKDKK